MTKTIAGNGIIEEKHNVSNVMPVGARAQSVHSAVAVRVYKKYLSQIQKRDGRIVALEFQKIVSAIEKSMKASNEGSEDEAVVVAHKVAGEMMRIAKTYKNFLPTVEGCQDEVERQLMLSDYVATSKAYILYRAERSKIRKEQGEVPERIAKLAEESRKYFKNNPLGEFVYLRTYARWIESEQRRETWIETVDRYVNFMKENLGDKLKKREYAEIREAILNQEVMPSMRAMQFAGAPAKKCNTCFYNCSFTAPVKLEDFAEIMYLSMQGCGVGYAVESYNIQQLPQIDRQTGEKLNTHVVADTKEGWCDSLTLGLNAWYSGRDVDFDFSLIRLAGARLKTMGGKASGPEPLRNLLAFARDRILKRQGRRLRNIDAHDIICKIGECVVAGGVRRTAMISLSDLDDVEIRDAKKGQFFLTDPHRSVANNSAVYETKPTNAELMDEWVALMKSGTGERGIFNRGSLEKTMPDRRLKFLQKKHGKKNGFIGQVGTNPCVPADTWVTTADGARQVRDLINVPFLALVNGKEYESKKGFFETGTKDVYEIKTKDGFTVRATENHQVLTVSYKTRKVQKNAWKRIDELSIGDSLVLHDHKHSVWKGAGTDTEGWLLGSLLGDGNIEKEGKANLDYWGDNRGNMMTLAASRVHETVGGRSDLRGHLSRTGYARVGSVALGTYAASYGMTYGHKIVTDDIERASSSFYEGFLRGWFDADGSIQGTQKKGVSIRLASSTRENLVRAQRMLARLGIIASLYENRRIAGWRMLPDGKGGQKSYWCEAQHELIIANDNMQTFSRRIGFADTAKKERLVHALGAYMRVQNSEAFSSPVVGISLVGAESVYDCTVDGAHAFDANGLYVHNCGEIILQSKEFCNLSEVIARASDTEKTLLKKAKLATLLGTYQSTLTNFNYISKEWKENCEAERLLGVSITGQWDSPAVRNAKTLHKMRAITQRANQAYAKRFGVNPSNSITCVKPSGTVSQAFDCSSGIHPRYSQYYIRRIRISATDSLFKVARDQGIPHSPEVGQTTGEANTYVLEFPVKAPPGSIFKDDISALEQLEYWKTVKLNFTEHNPSATISVGDEEWVAVVAWLYENWDIVGGLSFLPRSNHVYRLAPYESIDQKTYETLAARFPQVDYSKLVIYERTDETEQAKELACAGGTCEII